MSDVSDRILKRRVLVVVSSYRPAILADMQRARMLAWELPPLGWDVEVLTPGSREVRRDVLEPDDAGFFSRYELIHEVGSVFRSAFEFLGSRSPAWRTWAPMYRCGCALLKSQRFDLVYFSTTTFNYFFLGSRWQRKFRVPYVLDFHDPWVNERDVAAKSQSWKSRMARWLAIHMERVAVVNAAGLVAVSPKYIDMLRRRYGGSNPSWLAPDRHAVIPFGVLEADLVEAAKTAKGARQRSSDELAIHYVGAGGSIMLRSFALICRALALLRAQGNPLIDRVRIRLFGTTYNWKLGDARPLELVAHKAGVGDLVAEMPQRVSYRRSLELLLESDGALILGVDDAGYMPSKLFTYASSGKPLLASLRRDSPAFAYFQDTPELGDAIWFDQYGEMPITAAGQTANTFLQEVANRRFFDRKGIVDPFLASAMARRHVDLFNACLEPKNS